MSNNDLVVSIFLLIFFFFFGVGWFGVGLVVLVVGEFPVAKEV